MRHRRRSIRHVQYLVGGGARRCRLRRQGCQAREPIRVEPLRQRGRVRAARRQHRGAAAVVERTLQEANIAFFFAPTFHPSMKHAAQTRRELGIRTAFNLLGPLTNPAGARRQIVGVPRSELDRAGCAGAADARRPSARGSCTASTASTRSPRPATRRCWNVVTAPSTPFTSIRRNSACRRRRRWILQGGDAAQNAAIVRDVLDGAARRRLATSCC